ncbi:ATP-binding protein [Streptomyces sp. TRM76323]|uniref:ATP-binding protein n=1 Tax=Streptomyces tamarix TaxID=3078565 RepID=A0ABU3QFU6_9ACTN|nr:ATP-binding protein [Streptomyces tamarix]MDT9681576.1 ATP-binding protein [Streptomyces tamarix]
MNPQKALTSGSVVEAATPVLLRRFTVPLSATRRGARLARLLAAQQLQDWGLPVDPVRHVVAELAANAVLHGRVPGRSFRLTLSAAASGTVCVEVTDTRDDRLPVRGRAGAEALAESGYGLLLVEELADRWGVRTGPVPCKTVWAELDLAPHRWPAGQGAGDFDG